MSIDPSVELPTPVIREEDAYLAKVNEEQHLTDDEYLAKIKDRCESHGYGYLGSSMSTESLLPRKYRSFDLEFGTYPILTSARVAEFMAFVGEVRYVSSNQTRKAYGEFIKKCIPIGITPDDLGTYTHWM